MDSVVDKRMKNGKVEYKIRWKDFGPGDDSWEPLDGIFDLTVVDDYERKLSKFLRAKHHNVFVYSLLLCVRLLICVLTDCLRSVLFFCASVIIVGLQKTPSIFLLH